MPLIEVISILLLPVVVFALTQPAAQPQTKDVVNTEKVNTAKPAASRPKASDDLFLSGDFGIEEIIAKSGRDT